MKPMEVIAAGGKKYLKFARRELAVLTNLRKDLKLPSMQKQFKIGGSHIWLKSSEFGNIIRITGGVWNFFFRQDEPTPIRDWIGFSPNGAVDLAPRTSTGGFFVTLFPHSGLNVNRLNELGGFIAQLDIGTQGGDYRTVNVLDPNGVSHGLEWRTKAELDAEAAGGPPTPAPRNRSGGPPPGLQLQNFFAGLDDHFVVQTDVESSGTELRYQRPGVPAVKLTTGFGSGLMVTSRQDIALLSVGAGSEEPGVPLDAFRGAQAWDLDGGALGPVLNIPFIGDDRLRSNEHDGAGAGGLDFRMTYHDVLHVRLSSADFHPPFFITWVAVRNNVVLSHRVEHADNPFGQPGGEFLGTDSVGSLHQTKTSGYFFHTGHYTASTNPGLVGNISVGFSCSRMVGTLNPGTKEIDYELSDVDVGSVINLTGSRLPDIRDRGGTGLRSRAVIWVSISEVFEDDLGLLNTQTLYSLDSNGVLRVIESGVNQGFLYDLPVVVPLGDRPIMFVNGANSKVRVYDDIGLIHQFDGDYVPGQFAGLSYMGTRAGVAYVRGKRPAVDPIPVTLWLLGSDGSEMNLSQAALDYGFTSATAANVFSGAARSTKDTLYVMGLGLKPLGNPPVNTWTVAHVTHDGKFATYVVLPDGFAPPLGFGVGSFGNIGFGLRTPLLRYIEEDAWY